ncbi:Uncharacterised protein [Salmonella enterica subsp. enterica serovar Bovismorbificans]|uniref:Uncharacterized protein n=1 Tax=Salmonella enterica subsp. enterica serovar Bovismorbificans TaxID=58097 RepID=A0A655CRH7_SALET|nr:Uncharacterised protein [Salmonella enterica subsp. enterica serovar Bovismorbificans]
MAAGKNFSPSGDSFTTREVRSKRETSIWLSISLIKPLTAPCVMHRYLLAAVKLRKSATARNARNCRIVKFICHLCYPFTERILSQAG